MLYFDERDNMQQADGLETLRRFQRSINYDRRTLMRSSIETLEGLRDNAANHRRNAMINGDKRMFQKWNIKEKGYQMEIDDLERQIREINLHTLV